MTSNFFLGPLGIACLFLAGCGGGGGGASPQFPAVSLAAPAATGDGAAPGQAATGDGAAPDQAPIASAPACPGCAAAGTDVPPSPANSKRDCAP